MKQDLKWYPHQIITRHELRNPDYVRPLQFCQLFLHQRRNRRFLVNIIVGDKAGFSLNGEVNSRNIRQFGRVGKPPNFYYQRPDSLQKLRVWTGCCGNDRFLGPFFNGGNLNGNTYLQLHDEIIPHLTVMKK